MTPPQNQPTELKKAIEHVKWCNDNDRLINKVTLEKVLSTAKRVEELEKDIAIRDTQYKEAFGAWDKERDSLQSALREKDRVLCFFASVIKSGESWSDTCEKEFNKAINNPIVKAILKEKG